MNLEEIFSIILKSVVSLVILFGVTKLLGKKQVSELSLFDYVIGISIGNFTAEMTMDIDGQYMNGVVAMITFGVFGFLVSIISMKSIIYRRLIIGVPNVIIENGKILLSSLRKANIDINDLLEQARNAGYFDLSDVSYAIMEANGKISFLSKDASSQPTKKDLGMKTVPDCLTANIIIDGKFMKKNAQNTDKSREWFDKQFKVQGYDSYENILLAIYKNNKITIYPKNSQVLPNDVLE